MSSSMMEDELYDAIEETDTCAAVIDRKSKVSHCQTCGVKFSLVKRVHYCQRCGKSCCADCNSFRIIVDGEGGSFLTLKTCRLCKLEADELSRLLQSTSVAANGLSKHASMKRM